MAPTTDDANELAGQELKEEAQRLDIKGRSEMTADELRDAVVEAQHREEEEEGISEPDEEEEASEDEDSDEDEESDEDDEDDSDEEESDIEEVEEGSEFREQQKQQAKAQGNTAENAVPEQRPIASRQMVDSQQSETHRKLRDAGELPTQGEPMDQEAFERANSDEQREDAAEYEDQPNLIEGQRCVVDDEESPHHGRMCYVQRVEYDGLGAELMASSGSASNKAFAPVDHYIVKTRDGRVEQLTLSRDQLKPVDARDWGRGRI